MSADAFTTASETARLIREGRISAIEVMERCLARIASCNPPLNAIVTLDPKGSLQQAREADTAIARGERVGVLHGVPVALKDGHSTAGMRTTVGFKPLENYVPSADGAVAARLRKAGAIIIGKTNVPPLLTQPQTDNPIFGRTNNPWNLERTPGGSSGGAAAALAAGLVPLDIGSDLGGSIRMPAHFCGIFGLKPTARRVPVTGHIPDLPGKPRSDRVLATSGPMARSVADLALAFRVIAGPDGIDTEVAPLPIQEVAPPALRELRVAWAPTFPGVPVASDIRAALESVVRTLEQNRVRVEERLPEVRFEAMQVLWGDHYGLFMYVARQIWGLPVPERWARYEPPSFAGLLEMAEKRDEMIVAWERLLETCDAFICPTSMVTAFPHCPPSAPILVDGEPAKYGQINHHCFQFNITGHPVVVVPIGTDRDGLPIGAQLVGRRWEDERLLAVAATLAETTGGFRPPPAFA